jgi:ribosomal protein L29
MKSEKELSGMSKDELISEVQCLQDDLEEEKAWAREWMDQTEEFRRVLREIADTDTEPSPGRLAATALKNQTKK